jgi:hypothetical protein
MATHSALQSFKLAMPNIILSASGRLREKIHNSQEIELSGIHILDIGFQHRDWNTFCRGSA